MNNNLYSHQTDNPGSSIKGHAHGRMTLFVALFVAALISALWIWKDLQIDSIQKSHASREKTIQEASDLRIQQMKTRYLKLIARSYAWAIRNEIVRGNKEQLDFYGKQMVKDMNFISVIVLNKNGRVISAMSKEFENIDFASISHPYYLDLDSTIINKISDRFWVVASPVMGANDKLGTVVINYRAGRMSTAQNQGK
jgi:hypothetical protein